MKTYALTHDQLSRLMYDAIAMFLEYRDVHEKTEHSAPFHAVGEIMEGLDAMEDIEKELPGYSDDIGVEIAD